MMRPTVEVNHRRYRWPDIPAVVVCVDGSEPAYHEEAVAAGQMPWLAQADEYGTVLTAESTIPSFTNPNNLSIATGVPPAVHGICGNYFFDQAIGDEVMMNDPEFLRAPTIFAVFSSLGAKAVVITAKDKLRKLLGHEMQHGICFSAERADQATLAENGIEGVLELVGMPLPNVYSTDLSEFVLAAGVKVFERERPDLMYLSLTDYLQHKAAPGTQEANRFYAMLDRYFASLDALGTVLVLTADHGMNSKTDERGEPKIVYVQKHLDEWLGRDRARVILPITDPYTAHHGALGSFATVYLPEDVGREAVVTRLQMLPGIELALHREEACARYKLPGDRLGEVVLLAARDVCIGTSPERHNLSQLNGPLRSHGGLWEQKVPFIVNRKLVGLPPSHALRNYDAFWVATNYVADEQQLARASHAREEGEG
jgi:phosphonoacetate hydrolase